MTSKNSFWASCRENHKRRIWVWIVAVLSQLLLYGGATMIYLSRIKGFHESGSYKTPLQFQEAMYQAAKDALGFSDNLYGILFLLGAVIAMQGFSYLYDRRKVDMYHSVPVSKDRRFAVVYVNGLFIYLAANLSGLLLGVAVAASQGAVDAGVLADAGLAFVWNLSMFLAFYHMMILAVMVTGNRFVTVCVFLGFALYELCVHTLVCGLKGNFFDTYSSYYIASEPKLSVAYDCTAHIWEIKNMADTASKAGEAMPIAAKWLVIAAVFLGLAYFAYRKRASEAAGKAIAFGFIKPVLKVAVVIPAALMAGELVYDTSYQNEMLWALGIAVSSVIFCAAMEILYDFDVRSLFRHLPSSGVALAGVLAIFCIFKWDLFGYDSYIPVQNKVESIAISVDGYYDNYWDENLEYISSSEFKKENMFLTDTAPVLALVESVLQADPEQMSDARWVEILYRLKSGRQVSRSVRVDLDDPGTAALLDQIFRTDAFKRGTFQIVTDETSYDRLTGIAYTNGAARVAVPTEAALRLREAWLKDMEQFDFTLVRGSRPCGMILMDYGYHGQRQWFVYGSFENTIACLREFEAYYPMQLNAADIDSVTVTCNHNELYGSQDMSADNLARSGKEAEATVVVDTYTDYTVQETFYDEGQIGQILPHLYSTWVEAPWGSSGDMDENYMVDVVFKKDSVYPYERGRYYFSYNFWAGQAPDFVAEATAYTE